MCSAESAADRKASLLTASPAVASVGITEAEARARGIEPLVSRLPMAHVPRSLAAHDTRGFVNLVADAATRKIIGAQILAAEVGRDDHGSEAIKLATQTFDEDVGKLSCCAA